MSVEHIFLFREGLWRCEGEFLDAMGKLTRVAGEAQIRHYPDKWVYEGARRAVRRRQAAVGLEHRVDPVSGKTAALPGSAFVPAGDGSWRSTELTRGPWHPEHQHAGPPIALVARQIERAAAPLGV